MSGPELLILVIKISAIGGAIDGILRIALGIKEKPKVRTRCKKLLPWFDSIKRRKEAERRFFEKICK